MKTTIQLITTIFISLLIVSKGVAADDIRVLITKNGYTDETLFRFIPGATDGFDGNYDAVKMFSYNNAVPSLFSRTAEGYDVCINSLPPLKENRSLPLFVKFNSSGSYKLSFETQWNNAQTKLTLIEVSTGKTMTVTSGSSFTFTAPGAVSGTEPLFRLEVSIPPVVIASPQKCFGTPDGKIFIENTLSTSYSYTLKDGTGTISTKTGVVNADSIFNLAPGMYSLNIVSDNRTDSFNIMIAEAAELLADFEATSNFELDGNGSCHVELSSSNFVEYYWELGDGNTGTGANVEHSYSNAGSYEVRLIVVNNAGCKATKTKVINISALTTEKSEKNKTEQKVYVRGQELIISGLTSSNNILNVTLTDFTGKVIAQGSYLRPDEGSISLPVGYSKGLFILSVQSLTLSLSRIITL